MPSRQGATTALKAIVLSVLLLSGSTSASFIEHSEHQVIAEPKLINIPNSYRGHHSHGAHGHRHRARLNRKRTEGMVVEVPYTIWTGTFEDLKRRTPVAAKGDSKDQTNTSSSEDDFCTSVVCPKGTYCTKEGCCPNGKKCTGITTCLDATDSECPDNVACCPKGSPVCQESGGKGVCMRQKQEVPTTTSEPPKTTPTKANAAATTSKQPAATSTQETSTATSESATTTSTVDEESTAPPLPTLSSDTGVPTLVDSASTTSAAPTPSTTGVVGDLSSSSKIISGAVAGSIVALAFGTLIIYTIVKKRKENALARAEEASKAAPMSAPVSAAPMGSGGNGRPLSIQPEPEMLQMGPQAATVFTSGPQQGRSLREGIPPPSPPPNAVVGTPPYRRDQYGGQPGTPTSLRVGVPGPQIAQPWTPSQGYGENYPANFPFPEETYDAGYHGPAAPSPSAGSYQPYSPPGTPRHPPGTAYSPH